VSAAATPACGCCSGVTERTPLEVQNRPGLSAIAYRVGTHTDFFASMIAGLTDADRPRLADLGTRDRDDFSIALLDAFAVAADVLAFYNERLAQEAYLRTARGRISLQELGRLIGYRLRPGVAAETYLAFALEPPPDVPATATRDPGSAPPVTPAAATLEPGLRVQSIPGPGEQPQTFEAVEEVVARPEWNAIPASQTTPFTPALHDTHAYLEGAALDLKPGDAFVLAGADILHERWDLRILTRIIPDAEHERTRVEWAEPLGSDNPLVQPAATPQVYVLRKRINVFGHNAPMWKAMSDQFRGDYHAADPDRADWPDFTISATSGNAVDLDGSHPDVVIGSWVVLSMPTYRELWRVDEVAELSRAEFAVSGKVTRLTLADGENYPFFEDEVRNTTVFAVSEPLTLAEAPNDDAVEGDAIDVDVDVSGMAAGRRLLVRGTTAAGEEGAEPAVVKEVQGGGGDWRIVLDGDLSTAYERDSVIVHGNVALGTHGETVQQLLGAGRASTPFQRFTLAHDPLTHLQSSSDPSGAEAALDVRVNDVRWDEAPTLYGARPQDRAYALRTDEAGATYVQFGDGERGARLPSGSNNVRARYRKGLGAAGNVKAGALAQLLDRPLGVKGVSNPLAASGGVDPESEESARASIPLGVRTLGRAVSLLDYEDFARAFSGVAKAHAAVLPLRAGRTIVVSVAFTGGDRLDDLGTALRGHGDPRVQVLVLAGTTQTFRLALKVAVDPAYETDVVLTGVEAALRTAYSFEARGFTEPVFRSEVIAVAHTVPGVLAVDVDRLYAGATPSLADRLLAQTPAVGAGGTAIAAGVLVLDPAELDWLEAMT
jgi:hypothetical protein